MEDSKNIYDVVFYNDERSVALDFSESFEYCKNFIKNNNGSNVSYFAPKYGYKGNGYVAICNVRTGKFMYRHKVI